MIDPAIPLLDLHRHLEGSLRLETILDLGFQHGLPLPARDVEGLRPYVQVTEPQPGVMAFIARFEFVRRVLVDYLACRRAAYECVEDAWREGLAYLELRFSPWFMAETYSLEPQGVVEAVIDGVTAASRQLDFPVGLIGVLSRTYGPQVADLELAALLSCQDRLVALDLAGDEELWPAWHFMPHFQRARQAGWKVTIHAGEMCGSQSIWSAIRELGAVRIGHAVHAIEDPELMDYMAEHAIGIEANLTSNVQTSTAADYSSHPLRIFLERGLLATINTDDPGISGIDLAHEYKVAASQAGLSQAQVSQAQGNSLTIAFLSPLEKEALRFSRLEGGEHLPSLP